jgi:hypothetical protein
LDLEQIFCGQSKEFWKMIEESRNSKTFTWEEMEEQLREHTKEKPANGKKKSATENHRGNGKRLAESGKPGRK